MSDTDLTREFQGGEKLDGCDHHLRTDHELTENTSKIPDYKRANFNLARSLLIQTNWEYKKPTPVEGTWNDFKNKLLEVEGTTQKKRKYNLLKENSTDEEGQQYHQSLRACRTLIRLRKRDYEKQWQEKFSRRLSETNSSNSLNTTTSIPMLSTVSGISAHA